jgi:uncharacterized protein
MRWLLVACSLVALWGRPAGTQVRLLDESDRAAFRAWFVLIADAQFYRQADDVTDCAALVRHAVREALRPHTPEWIRQAALPLAPAYPDVRRPPQPVANGWPLFRVSATAFAEFADARTIIRFNTREVGREIRASRPGDLLYFHQAAAPVPDHLMVVIGPSAFDPSASDWLVYHTGPDGASPGEVRKVRLSDLVRHPSPRWRPVTENPAFVGVFRLVLP